ncbi:hypothetical protein C8P67_11168 [Flavobacterium aquicola]|uniref:Uncharacterized protein n=1 Tax=Flavobacterium aquicola TaxID=1682742 RepID=A0A3E0EGA3_9FLAO|nr:hypothetical protein C8P67_11168 [Flavobacterium aquicola]
MLIKIYYLLFKSLNFLFKILINIIKNLVFYIKFLMSICIILILLFKTWRCLDSIASNHLKSV